MKFSAMMDAIPQQVQTGMTGGAVTGAWASAVGLLQDWLGVGAAFLSIIWLSCQIWSWWEKRKRV